MRFAVSIFISLYSLCLLADPQNMIDPQMNKIPKPLQAAEELVQMGKIYYLISESCEDGTPQLSFPPKEVTGEITQVFGEFLVLKAEKFPDDSIVTEYWFEGMYLYSRNVSTEEAIATTLKIEDGNLVWYSALPEDKDISRRFCPEGNNHTRTVWSLNKPVELN